MTYASLSTFHSNNCNFRDNAALPKALSLIPIVGPFIQIFKERAILFSSQCSFSSNHTSDTIKSIKLKNQYKFLGIARDVFTLAAAITTLVLGILSPVSAIPFICLSGIGIGLNAWNIMKNEKTIKLLENPENSPKKIWIY